MSILIIIINNNSNNNNRDIYSVYIHIQNYVQFNYFTIEFVRTSE